MKTLQSLMDLNNRVALITGGGGHIARIAAEALAEMGAQLLLLDRDADALEQNSAHVKKHFPAVSVNSFVIDLEHEQAIAEAAQCIEQHTGRLDILINNAAFVGDSKLAGWAVPFAEQSLQAWQRAIHVNLTAAFTLTQTCCDYLKKSDHAAVLNISSIYGMVGPDMRLYQHTDMANPAAYAASKGGLLQLSRYLATVLAPDIRVNTITPGGIERRQAKEFQQRYVAKTPLGRMAKEIDLKGAIAYLASPLSAYVTGHNLIVDGGWTVW